MLSATAIPLQVPFVKEGSIQTPTVLAEREQRHLILATRYAHYMLTLSIRSALILKHTKGCGCMDQEQNEADGQWLYWPRLFKQVCEGFLQKVQSSALSLVMQQSEEKKLRFAAALALVLGDELLVGHTQVINGCLNWDRYNQLTLLSWKSLHFLLLQMFRRWREQQMSLRESDYQTVVNIVSNLLKTSGISFITHQLLF
jgi:hypothetical protein